MKYGAWRASNSKEELPALWAILKTTKDTKIHILQIYGDSKMVIEWASGNINITMPHLQHLLNEIQMLRSHFEQICFAHIYRELNTEVNFQ